MKRFSRLWYATYLAVIVTAPLARVQPADSRQQVPVIVAKAVQDRLSDRVEALGTLSARESVDLTATVTETITAIHFEDGQRVKKGVILVEMTDAEEHARIEEELSTMAEAQAQYERIKELVELDVATAAELDKRRREFDTARARLRALESKLKDRLIIAPFAGKIGLRDISIGTLVKPGDVVTTLDDDRVMKVDFPVPTIYLSTLKKGLAIEAYSPAFPERTFKGTVSGIDSRVDPVTRSITVRAVLPNSDFLLRPGMLMRVVLLKKTRQALVIPESALVQSGSESAVWSVDRSVAPPIAIRRKVTTGARRPGDVEITAGLAPGALVIVHGTQRVSDGQPVTVIAVDTGEQTLRQMLAGDAGGSPQ
jgi:membrane fusion protein (multidrug efflux system)